MRINVAVAAATVFNAQRDYRSEEQGGEGIDLPKRGEEINTRVIGEGSEEERRGVAICDRRAAIKSPLPSLFSVQ